MADFLDKQADFDGEEEEGSPKPRRFNDLNRPTTFQRVFLIFCALFFVFMFLTAVQANKNAVNGIINREYKLSIKNYSDYISIEKSWDLNGITGRSNTAITVSKHNDFALEKIKLVDIVFTFDLSGNFDGSPIRDTMKISELNKQDYKHPVSLESDLSGNWWYSSQTRIKIIAISGEIVYL